MKTTYLSRDSHSPTVFIDANTLISGMFFKGNESVLLKLGIFGSIKLVTCDLVIEEVKEVVRRKFPETIQTVDDVLSFVTVVKTIADITAEKLIRDKNDAPILATVMRYKPDYFVTGDKDFQTKEISRHVRVITTKKFLDKFFGR